MDLNKTRDFREPDELSDITLIVEDEQLYVHRQYLAEWSPVWRRMFLSGFIEHSAKEIPLPGKRLDEFTELLQCIYSTQKPISDHNVRFLLDLSEEYQIDQIKQRCEQFLEGQELSLDNLVLAQKYNLKNLYKCCLDYAKTRTLEELENSTDYRKLDSKTLIKIYKDKTDMIRDYANEVKQNEDKIKIECDQLRLEKENMKSILQTIPKLWEAPNKRCFRHMTGESFDFTCRDCNEKLHREVRKLCTEGQRFRRYNMTHSP